MAYKINYMYNGIKNFNIEILRTVDTDKRTLYYNLFSFLIFYVYIKIRLSNIEIYINFSKHYKRFINIMVI
jgi:hypothetical protein